MDHLGVSESNNKRPKILKVLSHKRSYEHLQLLSSVPFKRVKTNLNYFHLHTGTSSSYSHFSQANSSISSLVEPAHSALLQRSSQKRTLEDVDVVASLRKKPKVASYFGVCSSFFRENWINPQLGKDRQVCKRKMNHLSVIKSNNKRPKMMKVLSQKRSNEHLSFFSGVPLKRAKINPNSFHLLSETSSSFSHSNQSSGSISSLLELAHSTLLQSPSQKRKLEDADVIASLCKKPKVASQKRKMEHVDVFVSLSKKPKEA